MATVSYGLKITEAYHVFDKTITIYRNAVHYIYYHSEYLKHTSMSQSVKEVQY